MLTWLNLERIFCSSAVECGVVIKTLNTGEESGAADQSGESKFSKPPLFHSGLLLCAKYFHTHGQLSENLQQTRERRTVYTDGHTLSMHVSSRGQCKPFLH